MVDLFRMPAGVVTRWASFENPTAAPGEAGKENWGAKGHAFESIAAGETKVLLHTSGCGTIQRIWMTLRQWRPETLRSLRLEMTWDDVGETAVSVPLGDFFCAGLGVVPFESALCASPEGHSLLCTIPMPFRRSARITLTNESDELITHFLYEINMTLTDAHAEDVLYFHAHWRRESPTTLGRDFVVLPHVAGNGRFLGLYATVLTDSAYEGAWWGEGAVKFFIDGEDSKPVLMGTGTEDYTGTGWGQGAFAQQHQGSLHVDPERGWYAFYRFHVPDPIYFWSSCRVTAQQIGGASKAAVRQLTARGASLRVISADGGSRGQFRPLLTEKVSWEDKSIDDAAWCNFFRQDDWAAVAYFYLDRPGNDLPALMPVTERVHGLSEPEPGKANVPDAMLRSLYVPQSLRPKQNGFAFTLQNKLGTGTLVGFKALEVDGTAVDLSKVRLVTLHGVRRRAASITSATPLLFPLNTTLRVQVQDTPLAAGTHSLRVLLALQEIPGTLDVDISDFLGEEDV